MKHLEDRYACQFRTPGTLKITYYHLTNFTDGETEAQRMQWFV